LFIRLLSGLTPAEIQAANLHRLDECGLKEHLASTRANALSTMAATIQKAAAANA
ncbi:MAG: SufE family protein, partial [Akkermansia sp.]|nr:SufE family protein [Akkermansia sp.]